MNLATPDLRNYWTEFHETWWSYRYIDSYFVVISPIEVVKLWNFKSEPWRGLKIPKFNYRDGRTPIIHSQQCKNLFL
jgi:hypothetical protein